MKAIRAGRVAVALAALLILGACAPRDGATSAPSARRAPEPAQAPKVLTLVQIQEPNTFEGYTAGGGGGGGAKVESNLAMNHLLVSDGPGKYRAQLATQVPSVEQGTWRVNGDGSMDMTWKLRPDVKWHDGAPFTSADVLFAWRVNRDTDLPNADASIIALMESATAPDPTTFQVHWSRTHASALEPHGSVDPVGLTPMPRHLLEDLYQRDKQAFSQSSFFTTEYVGTGPYRLANWVQGSHTEYTRFDEYFLGRPPLDRVIVRYIGDPNTTIATILAGEADVVLPGTVQAEGGLTVKRRWEGTKNQVLVYPQESIEVIAPQYRADLAEPKQHGLAADRVVRQAMYQALDRQAIAEVITSGLGPVADSWISSQNVFRPQLEGGIPQYPHDPALAQQLLTQAGWIPGPDGVRVHNQTGERFTVPIWSRPLSGGERELLLISDFWKSVGADPSVNIISGAQATDRSFEATRPGVSLTKPDPTGWYGTRLHSKEIAGESNRWTGQNKFGYASPRFDQLADQLRETIDTREQARLHREVIQEVMGQVAIMPLYWFIHIMLVRDGVSVGNGSDTNIFEWNKQPI